MADWRQDDSRKPARRTKPVVKPGTKRSKQTTSSSALPKKKGWRKASSSTPQPEQQSGPTRTWTGSPDQGDAPASAGALRKWLIVGSLTTLSVAGIVAFLIFAFKQPQPLRIVLVSSSDYRAAELLSTPYSDSQQTRLNTVNPVNLRGLLFDDPSSAIDLLQGDSFLNGITAVSAQTVPTGGPSKQVVAFYINSYVKFDEDTMYLQSPKKLQFTGEGGVPGVALDQALSRIAQAVQPGSVAWVILDVQQPPVLSNFGDLNRPWATATQAAIEKIGPELRKRLLVTVPCDDGQQNWLAPEYSCSFFGYFVYELLAGQDVEKTALSQELRIGEFSRLLGERTGYAVASRRYAEQTPIWLPKTNLQKTKEYGLVTIDSGNGASPTNAIPSQEHFEAIEKLWQRLFDTGCQAAYRWDPLGYSIAESQLLRLEDVALFQPNKFNVVKDRVSKAIEEIKRPQAAFGVSLVEDRMREVFFNDNVAIQDHERIDLLAEALVNRLASDAELPSFWSPPSAPTGEAGEISTPPAESSLEMELRPKLVWRLYQSAAAGNMQQWEIVFQPARLNKALVYAGQENPTSIEMNLLKRLARDIDWRAASSAGSTEAGKAVSACQKAVSLFVQIQSIAASPENQSSKWLTGRLPKVERQYMFGVDRLLANQFREAQQEFAAVEQSLAPIKREHELLVSMISNVNKTLYATPHLLGWLLKEYPLADRTGRDEIQQQLRDLGKAINVCSQFYGLLRGELSGGLPADLRTQQEFLVKVVSNLAGEYQQYVDFKTSAKDTATANSSPLSFRRERIALLSPLTSLDVRKSLHQRTIEFLTGATGDSEEQKQTLPEQRSIDEAVEIFLGSLDFDEVNWAPLLQSDIRDSFKGLLATADKPSTSDADDLYSALVNSEYWLRAYASSIGSNPTLHARLSTKDMDRVGWPWTSAWQRWILSEAAHRTFQTQRLAAASWGDGEITDSLSGEQVLFYRLAQRYVLPGSLARLEPVNRLAPKLITAREFELDASLERLKQVQVDFGSVQKINLAVEQQLTPIRVQSARWDAVANLYLRHNGKRSPWLKEAPDDRGWAADLRESSTAEVKKFLDTKYWSGGFRVPAAALTIRGNTKIVSLDWEVGQTKLTPFVLEMEKVKPDGATLLVRSPSVRPTINVLLLVDCSASMKTEVGGFVEGQSSTDGKIEVSEKVKRVVQRVLQELAHIHGREANVQLSLMPFGLSAGNAEQVSSFLLSRDDDLNVFRTDFRALDKRWLGEIDAAVDQLVFKGDTPLYAAIVEALELTRIQSGDRSFIYVFSDGVNHTNDKKNESSSLEVERAVKLTDQTFVSMFHFDYFESWIAAQNLGPAVAAQWKAEVFNPGSRQLSRLSTDLKEKFTYQKSRNDDELLAESLKRLPSAKVEMYAKDRGQAPLLETNLDEPIRMAQGSLPGYYDVRVTGELGNADTTIELVGGEYVELQLKPDHSRLQHVAVDFNRKDSPAKSNDKLGYEAFLVPRLRDLSANSPLGLAINFGSADPDKFTFRPKFIVAEVSQSNDRSAPTIVLADHRFTSEISFPQAQLGYFEWPELRPDANVRVWAANGLPELLQLVNVEAGDVLDSVDLDSPRFGATRIRVEHRGQQIVVEVKYAKQPSPRERAVVICPAASKSRREFSQSLVSETHSFTLSDDAKNQTSQLQFATIADLEASKNGDLTELVFPPISTR